MLVSQSDGTVVSRECSSHVVPLQEGQRHVIHCVRTAEGDALLFLTSDNHVWDVGWDGMFVARAMCTRDGKAEGMGLR